MTRKSSCNVLRVRRTSLKMTEPMDQINSTLKALTESISQMEATSKSQWQVVNDRLMALEERRGENRVEQEEEEVIEDPRSFTALNRGCGPTGTATNHGEAQVSIQLGDLKWEYEVLKDSVSRIKLPSRYRINDSKAGINSKDREQAAVLVRSGRFIETGLKLMLESQKHWGDF